MMFANRLLKIAKVTRNKLKPLGRNSYVVSEAFTQQKRCVCVSQFQYNNKTFDLKESFDKSLMSDKAAEKKTEEAKAKSSTETSNTKTVSNEELLEKHMSGLSTDMYQKNRVYKNDFLRVLAKIKENNFSSKKQGLLMLKCCTELLPDEAPFSRMTLAEQVWNTIKPHTKFTVDHYNQLLRIYIANNRTVNAASFIKLMAPEKPNLETYELILACLGEAGDVNQATEVISNMKNNGIPATEKVFNALIIGQGKSKNIDSIPEILSAMKSLRIEPSIDTHTAIARAMAWNSKNELLFEELDRAYLRRMKFEETHIMDIVKTLAVVANLEPVPKVLKYLPEDILRTPSISPYMQSVATQLVYQNNALVALEIYKCLPLPAFGPKDDQGLHGRSLVRDCVKAGLPASVIALVTQELMATGRNPIAIQNAAEAALQLGKIPLALDMFTRMKQIGMGLRPHYFWPIFIQTSKSCGEKGIINTLHTMLSMDVTPDYETIMNYALPYVSFTSPQNLMKKLLQAGMTVTQVLTPMMETLAGSGQLRAASELCELFEGKVDAEKLIKPLIKGYLRSMDTKSLVYILQDITKKSPEKNKDWVGRFLCAFLQQDKTKADLSDFMEILTAIEKAKIKINFSVAEYCASNISELCKKERSEKIKSILMAIADESVVDEGDLFVTQMPHPKNMNEEALKAHLIELEAKGMNTRGVLRKLLQEYCRSGNLQAAKEIAEKCQKEGVKLSAGMKAAIFDLYVKLGEIDQAQIMLSELTKSSPNFVLDEFKVIDFATLFAFRGKFEKAIEVLTENAKKRHIQGGRNISLNCWRLLDTVARQGSAARTRKMLETLLSCRYCTPTNVLLGPLIRVHLKRNDLEAAVQEFARIGNQYKQTPLKHELLCKILIAMSDGQSEDNFIENERNNGMLSKMARTVLSVDKKVHGAGDVQLTLIAALAEVGYKKTLRKMLLDPEVKFHPDALLRRCERFADEGKSAPLLLLAECTKDIRQIDVAEIYEMIMDVYLRDDDCDKAIQLWVIMQEADVMPTAKFVQYICELCKKNDKAVPETIAPYVKKTAEEEEKEKVSNTEQRKKKEKVSNK